MDSSLDTPAPPTHGHVIHANQSLGRVVHLVGDGNRIVRIVPAFVIGDDSLDVVDERFATLASSARVVANKPTAIQIEYELPRQNVPCRPYENVVEELANRVVRQTEIIQKRQAGIRLIQLVIVGLGEHVVQHVFEDFGSVQVVALDVLALAALEALVERNHQQAAEHGFGLIPNPRNLVDALHHETVEKHVARVAVLAVHLERVARDDALERRRVVHERARVVLVGDNHGRMHQRREHEILAEVLQRNGSPVARSAKIAKQGAERALAVVAGRGIEPCGFIPAHIRANRCADNLPQELDHIGVVGQLVHPRHDIPVRAVLVVVDDGVPGTVDEIDVLLAREDERRVERHQNLVAVIVDAVVHGDQVAIAAALHARANRAKGLDGLVYILDGARLAIAADKALQILLANVVATLVVAAVLVNADIKVAVVMRVVPKDAHRMVQLVQDDGNLQGMETRQALVALRALLLVGIGVLQLRTGPRVRVALAKVVRVDAAVRQRQKLELERIAKGRVTRGLCPAGRTASHTPANRRTR